MYVYQGNIGNFTDKVLMAETVGILGYLDFQSSSPYSMPSEPLPRVRHRDCGRSIRFLDDL